LSSQASSLARPAWIEAVTARRPHRHERAVLACGERRATFHLSNLSFPAQLGLVPTIRWGTDTWRSIDADRQEWVPFFAADRTLCATVLRGYRANRGDLCRLTQTGTPAGWRGLRATRHFTRTPELYELDEFGNGRGVLQDATDPIAPN
jgi:hypothetical protein